MVTQTIQLKIAPKYRNLFNITIDSHETMDIEDFLEKLGINITMIKEMQYVKNMESDLKEGNYKISSKLGRSIK